ncbi:MAG: hypothetical protein FWE01_01315 [Firmicutes bacterium]|nr:hypothetical protein [Bacillota bacterium]
MIYRRYRGVLAFGIAMVFMLASMPFVLGFITSPISRVLANSSSDFYHTAPSQNVNPFSSALLDISNSDFTETTTNHFTEGVANWSTVTNSEGELVNSGPALAGTLNTFGFETFREQNNLTEVPFMTYNPNLQNPSLGNIMAIANPTVASQSVAGFQSNEFNFAANSFFAVEIGFYAVHSVSSVYLLPSNPDDLPLGMRNDIEIRQVVFQTGDNSNLEIASNRSQWRTATFFVRTCPMQDLNMRIGLFLGAFGRPSAGVVYYDSVRVYEMNEQQFNSRRNSRLQDNNLRGFVRDMDLRGHTESQHFALVRDGDNHHNISTSSFSPAFGDRNNAQLEMQSLMRTSIGTSSVVNLLGFNQSEDNPVYHFHPHTPNLAGTGQRNVMLMATRNNHAEMRMNGTVRIDRNLIYMVTFYSISSGGVGSFRIQDTRINDNNLGDHINPFTTGTVGIMEEGPMASRNNWVRNTIFLRGEAFNDVNIEFAFFLGSEDAPVTAGWIAIDDFSIRRVSQEFYSEHNEATNVQSFDMGFQEPTPNIANSFFNLGNPRSADNPFPLVARDWIHSYENEAYTRSGIVNTQQAHWNRYARNISAGQLGRPDAHRIGSNYGMAVSPGSINGQSINNNVFMLQNTRQTHQRIQSNPFQLGSGIHTVISFDVRTQRIENRDMNFYATIMMGERELRRINLSNLNPTRWHSFSFAVLPPAIINSDAPPEVSIAFVMGTEHTPSAAAVAFIDNVIAEEIADFNTNQSGVTFIDMRNIAGFSNPDGSAMFFSVGDGMRSNVIQSGNFAGHIEIESIGFRNGATVSTLFDTHVQSGIFYEYTVTLSIGNLMRSRAAEPERDLETGALLNNRPSDADFGINFGFYNFEGGLENIQPLHTNRLNPDRDGFVDLRFFVRTDVSQDLTFEITFGNRWYFVEGFIVVRSINVREIDEGDWRTAYNDVREAREAGEMTNMAIVTERGYVHTPDDRPEGGGRGIGELSMFIIPSVIMGVALIFAIVMICIRKVKIKRRVAYGAASYAKDDAGIGGSEALVAKRLNLKAKPISPTEDEIL